MKMKLELKHLAPYLPYKLKMTCPWMIKENTLTLVSTDGVTCHFTSDEFDGVMNAPLIELKPILRPLSDYTDINSDAMNDLNCDISTQIQICELAIKYIGVSDLYYSTVERCLLNHIDIFGLIDKNLAVPLT